MEIPKTTLEDEEKVLQGEERERFLTFMRRVLQWEPVDRPSAKELLNDPWLSVEDLSRAKPSDKKAEERE